MRTLKLILAYDGTAYVGWQRQRSGTSIQALVEDAFAPLGRGDRVTVTAAGRTDAGVHAAGQVASCRLESELDASAIRRALNARLPQDVRVLAVEDAPEGFHARFRARHKTYAYHVLNTDCGDPLIRHLVWHVPQRMDVDAMRAALRTLCGTHDFKAFQAAGSHVSTTVRTLSIASVESVPAGELTPLARSGVAVAGQPGLNTGTPGSEPSLLRYVFRGDGFLRHMVRTMVGTVVEVGLGRREASSVIGILEGRDRRRAGPAAPAQGLVLVSVEYTDGPPAPPPFGTSR